VDKWIRYIQGNQIERKAESKFKPHACVACAAQNNKPRKAPAEK